MRYARSRRSPSPPMRNGSALEKSSPAAAAGRRCRRASRSRSPSGESAPRFATPAVVPSSAAGAADAARVATLVTSACAADTARVATLATSACSAVGGVSGAVVSPVVWRQFRCVIESRHFMDSVAHLVRAISARAGVYPCWLRDWNDTFRDPNLVLLCLEYAVEPNLVHRLVGGGVVLGSILNVTLKVNGIIVRNDGEFTKALATRTARASARAGENKHRLELRADNLRTFSEGSLLPVRDTLRDLATQLDQLETKLATTLAAATAPTTIGADDATTAAVAAAKNLATLNTVRRLKRGYGHIGPTVKLSDAYLGVALLAAPTCQLIGGPPLARRRVRPYSQGHPSHLHFMPWQTLPYCSTFVTCTNGDSPACRPTRDSAACPWEGDLSIVNSGSSSSMFDGSDHPIHFDDVKSTTLAQFLCDELPRLTDHRLGDGAFEESTWGFLSLLSSHISLFNGF